LSLFRLSGKKGGDILFHSIIKIEPAKERSLSLGKRSGNNPRPGKEITMRMRKLAAVLAIVLMSSFAFAPSSQARLRDTDGDGVGNKKDKCPDTTGIGGETQFDSCQPPVPNILFPDGCSTQQRIDSCGGDPSCLKGIVNDLKSTGDLSRPEARSLKNCIDNEFD
jgi:hypothetical protein